MSLHSILVKIQMMNAVHGLCSLAECQTMMADLEIGNTLSVAAFMEFLVEGKRDLS